MNQPRSSAGPLKPRRTNTRTEFEQLDSVPDNLKQGEVVTAPVSSAFGGKFNAFVIRRGRGEADIAIPTAQGPRRTTAAGYNIDTYSVELGSRTMHLFALDDIPVETIDGNPFLRIRLNERQIARIPLEVIDLDTPGGQS